MGCVEEIRPDRVIGGMRLGGVQGNHVAHRCYGEQRLCVQLTALTPGVLGRESPDIHCYS